jgi:outer membrane murein-binding lipoprotein Lpp
MSPPTPFIARSARYGNRMNTTLEQLKSDVDALTARADVADSRAMETNRFLAGLSTKMDTVKSDVGGLSSAFERLGAGIRKDFMAVGTDVRVLNTLAKAVPDDIIRIDVNVSMINTNVDRISGNVARLDRTVTGLKEGMARVGERLDAMDQRLDTLDQRQDRMEKSIGDLRQEVTGLNRGIATLIRHFNLEDAVGEETGDSPNS